ncbi:MAG: hypothetical protein RLZZ561_1858 [Pseudomonadota bacterium]|jgi:hypothetical protein
MMPTALMEINWCDANIARFAALAVLHCKKLKLENFWGMAKKRQSNFGS